MKKQHLRDLFNNAIANKAEYVGVKIETRGMEKPARKDGNRAFCPDCGTTVRKNDNYCRICGQRLKMREPEKKPFYAEFKRKNNRRQIKAKRG